MTFQDKCKLSCKICGLDLDWKWSYCPDCGTYVANEMVIKND